VPELPEVETIARDLSSELTGQVVVKARFLNHAICEDGCYKSGTALKGKTLESISRRGKNLIFHFSGHKIPSSPRDQANVSLASDRIAMVCHLKMTGRLIVGAGSSFDARHLHFVIDFNRARLAFYDVRKFGRICVLKENELAAHPRLSKLGPEPFDLTACQFAKLVRNRKRQVKLVLLDQEVVAGLGNIYSDEALFDAGIRPTLRAHRLSRARLALLHQSVVKVLEAAIANRGTSVDDYLDGFGRSGRFQSLLRVYGKTGKPCPKCGRGIRRIVLGGRSTHFCPHCQK